MPDTPAPRVSIGVGGYGVAARLTGPRDMVGRLLAQAPPGIGRVPPHAPGLAHYQVRERGTTCVIERDGGDGLVAEGHADGGLAFWHDLELLVATHATTHVFIHAGAVAVDGCALVIPGRSRSGKTSLVKALLGLGATYLSDEFALLDADGWCHPYARPLSVRASTGTASTPVSPHLLTSRIATGKVRVGALAVTAYRRGAAWSPRQLSPGESVLALFGNAVSARVRTVQVLDAVTAVGRQARGIASPRGEADAVARWLLTYLAEPGE